MSQDPALPVVLVCTVGGSPQPIASAIKALRPAAVWFLVSDAKGNEPSRPHVEDEQIVYKRDPDPDRTIRGPGLRHVEGCPADVDIIDMPADDPDAGYALCRSVLVRARRRFPDHRIVADYTGGTKSMTGSLLMAAFAETGVEVQFMAGKRADLVEIASGTEAPKTMSTDFVLADRDFSAAEQAVGAHDYGAARRILAELERRIARMAAKPPRPWRDRLYLASKWTALMRDWDAFLHKEAAWVARMAHDRGEPLSRTLAASGHLESLLALGDRDVLKPTSILSYDLWLNAQRRAERGRYDDAIARLYRLVEASIQTRLWETYGKESEAPWDEVPVEVREGLTPKIDHATGRQLAPLGLDRGLRFIRHLNPNDELALVYGEGPNWLGRRNRSILAHGFTAVDAPIWQTAANWIETCLKPFWSHVAFPQLPTAIPRP